MKRTSIGIIVLMLVALAVSLSATAAPVPGPFVDSIYFDVRMQEEIGLKDVVTGKTDIFMDGQPAATIRGLDKAEQANLEMYSVPSTTYSLFMNPIPNKAPYIHKVGNKEVFNPFAIREVRFALNFLINRKYIVNEIIGGAGGPMYTISTPGQPGTIPYELNAAKMGFTAEGDEARAIEEINAAFEKAAKLDAVGGRLKKAKYWEFDGEPLTVKFAIRVDDPTVRVKEGEYVSQQLEKAGIKTEKLMWDRSKCNKIVYGGNPADYEWTMYTEAWGAGATRAWWAHIVAQFYGPWYGYMPGGGDPANWNYENKLIDDLSAKAYSGDVLTADEYWDSILKAQTAGLKDAVRIQIAYQADTFAANKKNFTQRFAYGLGDGVNQWSLITAKPKTKNLKVTLYSAKGALFMSSWDPIGVDGFSDTYSRAISDNLYDQAQFESPVDGGFVANRAITQSFETKVTRENGKMVGHFDVPATAKVYDPKANKWVPVGPGVKAWSVGKYKMVFSNLHHGIMVGLEDYLYGEAFVEEWRTKDDDNDKWYDAEYDSQLTPMSDVGIAQVFDPKTKTYTVYGNYNFPADKVYAAASLAPSWSCSAQAGVGVSWEISEALARMVAIGSKSGEVWSFSENKEGTTHVDVLNPKCVADIKAELNEMIKAKHVPDSLKGIITADRAVTRYKAALKFVETYGHAYISNGPFFLAKHDPKANYAEIRAFRDKTYPYNSQHWLDTFKRTVLSVENIDMPLLNVRGTDIPVKIRVSQSVYPEISGKPATVGTASVMLITPDGEKKFEAKRTAAGVFEVKIPGSVTKDLTVGSYTVVILLAGDKTVVGTNQAKVIVLR